MPAPFELALNTKQLIFDVRELVGKGQPVPTAPGEWIIMTPALINLKNRALRLADRNKRNIVLAVGGAVATGLITGGIAPALYVAVKATSIGGKRIYRYFEGQNALDSIRFYFGEAYVNPDGTTKDMEFSGQEADSKDIPAFRAILFKIQSILSHRDFANLVNYFKDLVNAREDFQREWKGWNNYRTCGEYIKLVEVTERLRYSYGRLASAMYFFRQLIRFMQERTKVMLEESPQLYREFLKELVRQKSGTQGAIEVLNDAANSDQVFHRFTTFGKKNYLDFIHMDLKYLGVSDALPFNPKVNLTDLTREDGIDKGLLNIIRDATGDAVSIQNQNAYAIAATSAGGQVSSQGAKLAGVAPNVGMATTVGFAGGEFAANIATQIANSKYNERRYQHKDQWSWKDFGFEKMTNAEAIANVERLAKGELEGLIKKFDHWLTSHKEFKVNFRSEPIEQSAVRALRARKHFYQSVCSMGYKYLLDMYYSLMDNSIEEFNEAFGDEENLGLTREDVIHGELDEFFKEGHPDHVCSGYCYQRVAKLFQRSAQDDIISGPGSMTLDPKVAELPVKPISSRNNISKIEV